jgi:hypothetical protein
MSEIVLKGFPTEIGNEIELPDMAELLAYPSFFDVSADDFYKYGTEFQKYLLDKTPLKNDKKTVSVLCQVKYLSKDTRSCTPVRAGWGGHYEWHIDNEADNSHIYTVPRDRVHLMTSQTTSMTEFLADEVSIPLPLDTPYTEFKEYLHDFPYLLKGKPMPANRIVTFDNHMHRATPSQRIEFKFMFRVVETDRERQPEPYSFEAQAKSLVYDGNRGDFIDNIERQKGKVVIYLPSLSPDVMYKPKNESK